jgi:hypothetical protein
LAVPHPFSAFPRDRGVFNAGGDGDVGDVGVDRYRKCPFQVVKSC